MLKHVTDLIVKVSLLPFSDERFLERDLFQKIMSLVPPPGSTFATYSKADGLYKQYENFQRETAKCLQKKHTVTNPDMVHLLVEKYFPLKAFEQYSTVGDFYLDYISRLAKCFICHRDGEMTFKYWLNDSYNTMYEAFDGVSKLELWNNFSRQFCVDLLVCAYLLDNDMDDRQYLNGYYWLLNLADKQLGFILEKGVAETHLHINAGIHFITIWERLLDLQAPDAETHQVLKDVGRGYSAKIRMAAVSRQLMCEYLAQLETHQDAFEAYCSVRNDAQVSEIVHCFFNGQSISKDIHYKMLFPGESHTVRELFGCMGLDTTDENVFLFQALRYLRTKQGRDDLFFNGLFWKYIRLKNLIYQSVTQNDNQQGLLAFQAYFGRAANKGSRTRGEHIRQAIKNQIYNNHLKKMEIRITPAGDEKKGRMKALRKDLRLILEIYKELLASDHLQGRVPQIGVVFHMVKRKDNVFFEKCWCTEDEKQYFYGDLQNRYIETVKEIVRLRDTIPGMASFIVGIDAASIENNTEPWVFAPVFRAARGSKQPRFVLGDNQEPIQSLGFTYHVGEEFRHLVSGLRHIDEVVERFGYHAGDRIGHGVALGEDVAGWVRNNAITVLPRIEYLENLLWIWGLGYSNVIDTASTGMGRIEREIMTQATAIYYNLQGITVYNLWCAYQKKFQQFSPNMDYMEQICQTAFQGNPGKMPSQGCLCCRANPLFTFSWDADKLLHAYHCKCYLERMYEVIQVKVEEKEGALFALLQKAVGERVDQKGIIVETNPTSNLVISGMERLFSHHAAVLNPCGEKSGEGRMIITINSDDPVVFNTSISNELSYIFYQLLHRGYPRETVLEWIDKIRQWGLDTSFIKLDREDIETRINRIDGLLRELR